MMGSMKSAGAVCAMLLVVVFSAGAQDAGPPDGQAARRLLLVVTRAGNSTLAANDIQLLSRSILMQVQKATSEVVVVESPGSPADVSQTALEQAAKGAGADSWLSVAASGSWTALKLGVKSFDLISSSMVMDISVSRGEWQSALDLALEPWDEIVRPVAGHYHFVQTVASPQGARLARLTIAAIPGTTIDGLGSPALVADENGTASRDVPVPREYTLHARLRGHSVVSSSIFVSGDRVVKLEQHPISSWALDFSLQDQAYPGVGLSWSPLPGIVAIELQVTSYLVGVSLGTAELFSSAPVTDVALQAGIYLPFQPRLIRAYTMLGVSVRIDSPLQSPLSLDALSPFAVKAMVGAELALSERGSFFLEYAPAAYFTAVPLLLQAALGPGNAPPGWLFTSGVGFNLLSFRAGFRWQL